MADIVVKAASLNGLHLALAQVAVLSPPPSPKGRYALAKALKAVTSAAATYGEQHTALLVQHAKKDEKDQPVKKEVGEGRVQYELADREAFERDYRQLGDEDVTLAGTRLVTRAELADCPITIQQEAVLVECGLLEDAEPQ